MISLRIIIEFLIFAFGLCALRTETAGLPSDISSLGITYVPSTFAPRGYITGWFFKSDYSCTSFPPQMVFSFATGVCYSNTSTGQNFVLTANGSVKKDQLVVQITTYWDSKCSNPQSLGSAPGYNTLCTVQNFAGYNFYGHFTFSPRVPTMVTAPGYELRYYDSEANCHLRSDAATMAAQAKSDLSSTRPYLVSWQSTEYSNIIVPYDCNSKLYPKYGAGFYAKSQDTALPGMEDTQVGRRNFLSCFSENETVMNEMGISVPIKSLQPFDRIVSANANGDVVIAEVVAVPHAGRAVESYFPLKVQFLRLTTDSGLSILVTEDHLMLGGACQQQFSLLAARNIGVGMCVGTLEGQSIIVANGVEAAHGGYVTVVTSSEYIVVSGFKASPFSWNHEAGNAFYLMPRLIHRVWPSAYRNYGHQWLTQGLNLFAHMVNMVVS